MNLGFKTEFPWRRKYSQSPTHPNYFIEKIWESIWEYDLIKSDEFLGVANIQDKFVKAHYEKFGRGWDNRYLLDPEQSEFPKIHTIRIDEHDRWKANNKIDFWINTRTKNMFRFAPILKCRSIQNIFFEGQDVYVDGKELSDKEVSELAQNDSFNSIDDFFKWFGADYTGKIIHWTDKKY